MGSKPSLYIKLVKRARKFLRSNFMRRFPFLVKLLRPLFEREYWVPTPHRMAMGLSIGVFFAFAMLIIPIQMLCAAVTCSNNGIDADRVRYNRIKTSIRSDAGIHHARFKYDWF